MGYLKLSHCLLDNGFFSALGTTEHPGHSEKGVLVKRGTPFTYDQNNGVTVVYDEDGRPWVCRNMQLGNEVLGGIYLDQEFPTLELRRGAHVPHSNDGGHFVREIMPQL